MPASFPQAGRFWFDYRVTVKPGDASAGRDLSLWVPYPVEDEFQTVHDFEVASSWPWSLHAEAEHGNKIIFIRAKTPEKPVTLNFRYLVERRLSRAYSAGASGRFLRPARYLKPSRMIPAYPAIRRMAETATKGVAGPGRKLESLYRYVVDIMQYDKSGTGWGQGDAVWACDAKRGNCTDFHSLFIGMARSQGIPARFEIGFPVPWDVDSGAIPGYHCWARGFDPERGWLPLDATEAKKTGATGAYFGTLPPNRIHFSSGRDIRLEPPQKGEPLNFFIYPYAEADGKPLSGLTSEFRFHKAAFAERVPQGVDVKPVAARDTPPEPALPESGFPAMVEDVDGKTVDVRKLAQKTRVVVITLKATWCPVCQNQLLRIKDRLKNPGGCAATFLVLAPGPAEHLRAIRENTGFDYPFIEDKGLAIAKSLGLQMSEEEIFPSIFVLGPDLKLLWLQKGRGAGTYGDNSLLERLNCAGLI